MKITYIHHSSFCVEDENRVFLFDYFLGDIPEFHKDAEIFVFASHKHPDHFSLDIFELSKKYGHVTYFLGNDIKLNDKYLKRKEIDLKVKKDIVSIKRHTKTRFRGIQVEALDSTDQGVAFVVTYDEKVLYHGGDLNWWDWKEVKPEENAQMKDKYQNEIDIISGRHIDVAFVPVDPRLEESYALGIHYFMKQTDTDVVFPMHFWREYDVILRLRESEGARAYRDKIKCIKDEGDSWTI